MKGVIMQPERSTVLIVDDEIAVADLLEDALTLGGYQTLRAENGMEALRLVREQSPDLLLLDINMPLMNGFEVLSRMRERGIDTPVLFLTARDDRDDEKHGLKLGADDYVTKPFGVEELILRVKAVLRRAKKEVPEVNLLAVGPIEMNIENRQVLVDGRDVSLSPTEFKLLNYLLQNKNRVLTKQQLLSNVWGINYDSDTTVLDTYISYLRKKIDAQGYGLIKTVRGVGFQLKDPKSAA
jgi:two-component system, OmpR family, response regulator